MSENDPLWQLPPGSEPNGAADREYARTIALISAAAKTGAISQKEIADAVGLATKAYEDAGTKAGSVDLGKTIAVGCDRAPDSLLNFANTGKASIREFASGVVADIRKAAAQALIFQALSSLGGSIGGGTGKFLTQLAGNFGRGLAEGGPVRRGKSYLVGEQGPEMFVPPSRGTIIPNGEGGGKTPVNFNIHIDPNNFVNVMSSREGEDVILRVMQRNRGKVREILG